MFDVLTQGLEVVLFIAVLIMFFGLVARSDVRAARILGWFSVAWGTAVVIVEGFGWYDKGDWIIMPARQLWSQIDRSSLHAVESMLERNFPSPIVDGAEWLLTWPAWAILGLMGVFFLIYDHVQLQRLHKGTPPPPLWRRLITWVRETTNPREEQA
jgi:hypothetical protein